MGILFLVAAGIVAVRNLLLDYIDYSAGLVGDSTKRFFDNFTNAQLTNEKFVVAMIGIAAFLLYWGYFKKREDYGPPDEHERRRFEDH